MKKKLFLLFSLVLCLFLASCRSNGNIQVKLTDNADATVYETLNLSVLENGVSINSNLDRTQENYIDVILPSNPKTSLIVRNVVMDSVLKDNRVKDVNAKVLTFVSGISAEYQTAIMAEIYNDDYGITKEKLGLSVDILKSTSFSVNVDSSKGLDYYNEGKTNITLSVIYFPAKVVIVSDDVIIAEVTVLVPVYAEFNLGDDASSVITSYKAVNVELAEDGTLPKKQS